MFKALSTSFCIAVLCGSAAVLCPSAWAQAQAQAAGAAAPPASPAPPASRYLPPSPYSPSAGVANGQDGAIGGRAGGSGSMPTPLPAPVSRVQQALDQAAPLTRDELLELRRALMDRQQAASENVTGRKPARPTTSAENLDLSPGATPPVIRVAVGQGTVIAFIDAAGRPWEIADDLNFNSRAFAVRLLGPHLYSVTLKAPEPAHLAVVLKGLARPISITAVPAVDEADYIKEFVVPRFIDGQPPPSVASSSSEGALAFNAPELLAYLYRTPPKTARALKAEGLPGVTAWQTSATRMVVRTSGQVIIPAFSRRHGSSDGATVFELPLSPVVSITQGAAVHRVQISGMSIESAQAPAAPAR